MSRSTFPAYADFCGWNAMLPARSAKPFATGKIVAKYAVVGAGYTGLAAARRLHELDPQADIVILEATDVGEGSSGRNSGFASPVEVAGDASAAAVQRTQERNRLTREGFDWLKQIIDANGIDCELQKTPRIKAAATERGEHVVRNLLEVARKIGVAHAALDSEQIKERIGSAYYRCGILSEEGYLLQPAALVRGLADCLPGNIALHERSPVLSLKKRVKWHLETDQASVEADNVILANNAAVRKFGYLRDRLVTILTYAAITRKLAAPDVVKLGAMAAWGVLPAHRLGTTVRRVGVDRLMVRSLYAHERGIAPKQVHAELLSCFHRRYPDLSHVELEFVWGGTTALTMNGSPFWGALGDGLYTSAGCNGAGIVKGTLLGKRLAELIAGQGKSPDVLASYGEANWVAPEPFRSLGFEVVSAIQKRQAGKEK